MPPPQSRFPMLALAGAARAWGRARLSNCLLHIIYCVGVRVVSFRSSIAHPAYTPVYASLSSSRYQRKTRGRVDR